MAQRIKDLLVVTDIDGTLLQAGYGIPKENIDAIDRFVSKGGRFTVCSGRSVESVRRYAEWIQMTAPAILNNGAVIYDFRREKVLYMNALSDNAIDILKEIRMTFPDVGVELHSVARIVVLWQNIETHSHLESGHIPYMLDDIDSANGVWTKALLCGSPHRMKKVDQFVRSSRKKDARYQEFDFVFSSDRFLEMLSQGVNKGTGLKRLVELLKTDIEDTVAIGDYYNDMPMLEAAGFSAAVADAPAEIRARVDTVVKSCMQGGVGELLDSAELLCDGYEQLHFEM